MSDNLSVSLQSPASTPGLTDSSVVSGSLGGSSRLSDTYSNEITILGNPAANGDSCGMSGIGAFLETVSGIVSQLISLVRDLTRTNTGASVPPPSGITTPTPPGQTTPSTTTTPAPAQTTPAPTTTTNPATGTSSTTAPTTTPAPSTSTPPTSTSNTTNSTSSVVKELLAGFSAMFDKLMDRIAKLEKKLKKLGGSKKKKKSSSSAAQRSSQTSGAQATEKTNTLSGSGLSSGFLWKPASERDGKLAIILPPDLTGQIAKVSVVGANGAEVQGSYSGLGNPIAGGEREHYRFNQSGSDFGNGAKVLLTLKDGTTKEIEIADTASRNET